MTAIGFTDAEQKQIMRLVAAILHLGNIKFSENNSGQTIVTNDTGMLLLCHYTT